MLFINIYDKMDSFADIRWDVVAYAVTVICVIFGLGLLTAVLTTKKAKRRGVILQCTFRSNFAIIGLTLVDRLGGDLGLAGMISAFSIPIFNILAVIALSVFTDKELPLSQKADQTHTFDRVELSGAIAVKSIKSKRSVKYVLLNIVKNPLIIGVAAGLLCVGIREIERAICGEVVFALSNQLKFLYVVVNDLKVIASPLALIVLGAQFEFSEVKGMTKEILVGTAWRIIIAPVIGIGAAYLLSSYTDIISFGTDVYPTLIALFGTPVAVSSAIMAGEMGSDEQLATQLVVWTSLVSIVTIFITVFVLMAFGLLTM